MVVFELHGHLASYDGWIRWFLRQGIDLPTAKIIVDTLIKEGYLVYKKGKKREGYYPYHVPEDRFFRVGETEVFHLITTHTIYGHLIYKPLGKQKPIKFKEGQMKLSDYLEALGIKEEEQKRSDHPIALEVYVEYESGEILDLNDSEIKDIIKAAEEELNAEGFGFGKEDFVWGLTREYYIDEEEKEWIVEAVKRWTRDGTVWQEVDIRSEIEKALF